MEALERLGRRDELRMLERVAEHVREQMHERRRGDHEREQAKLQLRALRIAFETIHARKDERSQRAAKMVEHAMHARELRLKGRRDKEARRVYESAPNEANVIELLGWASKLLKEQRKREEAEFVGGVAERMHAAWKEHRERGRDDERNLHERVERLERRLEKLANIVERLVDELEDDD